MFAPLIEEWDTDLHSGDPLGFPGYADKLISVDHESVITGRADGFVLIEGDFDVIGGSMGLVHGEKVVRAFDRAIEARLPVVAVTRSGGARMQEGMVSLIQMARTAAAARRHQAAGLLSISVHRQPTTGGVLASYGSLSDLRVVEAGAVIGFAGPRVVQQTTGEDVDGVSHAAETAYAAQLVDAVAPPEDLPAWVRGALGSEDAPLRTSRAPTPIRKGSVGAGPDAGADAAWAEVRAARAMGRPTGIHLAATVTDSWTELGEGTDPTLRTGLASIDGHRVVVVAFDRYAGGGRPSASGFRLAQRGLALAGRLGVPVVSFLDTPGADPSSQAENDGVAAEIARTFAAMADVASPTISVCVGEGGSGGALALGAADRLLIQEHAIFSVIAPEGAAAILERDASKAPEMAALLKLTSTDLVELGIADAVIGESGSAVTEAVRGALADGRAGRLEGGRRRRFDAATERWLRTR